MNEEINPYKATAVDPSSLTREEPLYKTTTFGEAFLRWGMICVVSAVPSFFFGLAVTNAQPWCIAAMVVGVLLFALAYAYVDTRPFWRRAMADPVRRRAIVTTYGLRIVASVILVGGANDMMIGTFSASPFFRESEDMAILETLATTLARRVFC